jgi:hypothetical protein
VNNNNYPDMPQKLIYIYSLGRQISIQGVTDMNITRNLLIMSIGTLMVIASVGFIAATVADSGAKDQGVTQNLNKET